MKRKERYKRKQAKKRHSKGVEAAHENEEFKVLFKINQALSTKNYALLREIGQDTGFINNPVRRRVW
jgi:hypothetical protein